MSAAMPALPSLQSVPVRYWCYSIASAVRFEEYGLNALSFYFIPQEVGNAFNMICTMLFRETLCKMTFSINMRQDYESR